LLRNVCVGLGVIDRPEDRSLREAFQALGFEFASARERARSGKTRGLTRETRNDARNEDSAVGAALAGLSEEGEGTAALGS